MPQKAHLAGEQFSPGSLVEWGFGEQEHIVTLGPAFTEVTRDLKQFSWRWEKLLFLHEVREVLPPNCRGAGAKGAVYNHIARTGEVTP